MSEWPAYINCDQDEDEEADEDRDYDPSSPMSLAQTHAVAGESSSPWGAGEGEGAGMLDYCHQEEMCMTHSSQHLSHRYRDMEVCVRLCY